MLLTLRRGARDRVGMAFAFLRRRGATSSRVRVRTPVCPAAHSAGASSTAWRGIAWRLLLAVCAAPLLSGASHPAPAEGARLLAQVTDARITESSGLAASRLSPGLFWTHNDSGAAAVLYAIDRRGRVAATLELRGVTAGDWEDVAIGPGPAGPSLYIGDIGDNARHRRDLALLRVAEPRVPSGRGRVRLAAETERFPFEYPDGSHDAEALLVHPTTGETLIVTKDATGRSGVYRFPMPLVRDRTAVLERVATVSFTNALEWGRQRVGRLATGGAVSPDGARVFLRTYVEGYEWLVPPGATLAEALRGRPRVVAMPFLGQFEAVSYRLDGRAVLTTSEGSPCQLWEVDLTEAPAPHRPQARGPRTPTGRPTE